MKIILINSFNTDKYVLNAMALSDKIETCGFITIVVYGGSSKFLCLRLGESKWVITIPANLSDNNAFVGFEMAYKYGFFRETIFREATYVYIHDTCQLSDKFATRMDELPTVKGWVFAHIYGLYNIGVCDQTFLLTRAKDFVGLTKIPKDKSIALEQGEHVTIDGFCIKPLIHYSNKTLAEIVTDDMNKCDFMSLNAQKSSVSRRRYITFIGSLGIYKFVGSHISYFVPIWASKAHEVKNQDDYDTMKASFSRIQLSTESGSIGSITPWIPLPHY